MKRNKVKHFREAIPLSIIEVARRAGLAYQTVSKMERGLPTRKHSQLKVAKALNKKHEDVFGSAPQIIYYMALTGGHIAGTQEPSTIFLLLGLGLIWVVGAKRKLKG